MERQATAVLLAGDRREKLNKLKVPTVVLHGAADIMVPVENGRDTTANIPGAEVRLIPGMGHEVPLALVKEFADAITAAASRGNTGRAVLRKSGHEKQHARQTSSGACATSGL